MIKSSKSVSYTVLYLVLLASSLGNVLAKLASDYSFMSYNFIFLYGASLFISVFYAVVWQQIIKNLPLTVAYANRAVLVVFGMLWGLLIFGEPIRWNMLLGTAIIFIGIILLVRCDE